MQIGSQTLGRIKFSGLNKLLTHRRTRFSTIVIVSPTVQGTNHPLKSVSVYRLNDNTKIRIWTIILDYL